EEGRDSNQCPVARPSRVPGLSRPRCGRSRQGRYHARDLQADIARPSRESAQLATPAPATPGHLRLHRRNSPRTGSISLARAVQRPSSFCRERICSRLVVESTLPGTCPKLLSACASLLVPRTTVEVSAND